MFHQFNQFDKAFPTIKVAYNNNHN
jgi:hypothetical protein